MSSLILQYKYDDRIPVDSFGRLTVEVETERASGWGGFWVQWQDVVEFGEALARYPIAQGDPVRAQWGYELQEEYHLIISIEIAAANSTGDLNVRVEIADDCYPKERMTTSFQTSYPQVETFRLELDRLMKREIPEAVLRGQ